MVRLVGGSQVLQEQRFEHIVSLTQTGIYPTRRKKMQSRQLFMCALGVIGSALLLAVASNSASAMYVSNTPSVAGAPMVEKVWCNRWRCGVGPGIFHPYAVGGIWHPWGYGVRPYRWCYYHPRQC